MQIYKKVFYYTLILVAVTQGCSKDIAPQTVKPTPGKSNQRINREQRRRERKAFWYNQKTNRITRKTERKLERLKGKSIRAEKKLQQRHIKNQDAKTQERMKETRKESENNNTKRTLRQRLRLWKYKK